MHSGQSKIGTDLKQSTPAIFILIMLLSCTIFLRAATLEDIEMLDPTEARYATVAQEMVVSGDWTTPKIPSLDGYIPYLGKPPFHFWLTAISFELFGMDEWVARLPSFLALMVMLGCVYVFAERFFSPGGGVIAALITISSSLLFFFAGSSITDVTLGACVAVVMLSFARCISAETERERITWGLLVFLAAALGFLTKGPVAFVLAGIPIFIWCALQRRFKSLVKLPWVGGMSLLLLVVVPWFVRAEMHNPGFIRYFFINENFGRYLVHEYGDRYGSGHEYPRGSVWWMFIAAFLPWSILALMTLRSAKREVWQMRRSSDLAGWATYVLLWGLSPAIFFSLVRQLHPAYVVPGIPGMALWITFLLTATAADSRSRQICQSFVSWMTHYLPVLLVLLAAAAIYVSLNFSIAAYALIPLLFAVLLERLLRPRNSSLTLQVGYVAAVLVSVFAAASFIASPYISESQSAESILQYVIDNSPEAQPVVAVIRARNYSPWYLERAALVELGSKFTLIGVAPTELITSAPRNIILTSKESKLIPENVRADYVERTRISNWIWLQRKIED